MRYAHLQPEHLKGAMAALGARVSMGEQSGPEAGKMKR
jgi:hypothetical protein